jgi:hypothetical protein
MLGLREVRVLIRNGGERKKKVKRLGRTRVIKPFRACRNLASRFLIEETFGIINRGELGVFTNRGWAKWQWSFRT